MSNHQKLTNWYVITGAPCSGKTTVITALERSGQRVVHEVARAYIDELLGSGKNLEKIKAEPLSFEREILHRKFKIETALDPDDIVFFDRGMPDSIAYFRISGIDPFEAIEKCRFFRYNKVFHFERLGFQKDRVRYEDDATAGVMDRLIKESYEITGYKEIHVPLFSTEERLRFVLDMV